MRKPRTQFEKDAVKVNSKLSENISLCDKKIIIKGIKSDEKLSKLNRGGYIYFTLKEKKKNLDVTRLYRCYVFSNKKTGTCYIFCEIARKFANDSQSCYFSKKRFCMNCYTSWDTFSFGSDITLTSNHQNTWGYSISGLFEESQFDINRHAGKRVKCVSTNPKEISKILKVPYGETLYNANEDLIIGALTFYCNTKELLSSIRIARKHGFVFTDENTHEWFDMTDAIIKTKNDNHNPKFVAPDDLNNMHNYFISKLRTLQRKKERLAEERAMIKREKEQLARLESERKENDDYIKRRRRFFDLNISNSQFDIHVLRDVQEFFEEGTMMHHCVFASGYYKRPESLILSCRDKQGNRVETIEVDLKTFKIAQCYGKYDKFTEHHKAILNLIKKNMNKIRMCYNGRYKAHKENKELLQAV